MVASKKDKYVSIEFVDNFRSLESSSGENAEWGLNTRQLIEEDEISPNKMGDVRYKGPKLSMKNLKMEFVASPMIAGAFVPSSVIIWCH